MRWRSLNLGTRGTTTAGGGGDGGCGGATVVATLLEGDVLSSAPSPPAAGEEECGGGREGGAEARRAGPMGRGTEGGVVFMSSTCFDGELMTAIARKCARLRRGAVVVSFTRALTDGQPSGDGGGGGPGGGGAVLEVVSKRSLAMSWVPPEYTSTEGYKAGIISL